VKYVLAYEVASMYFSWTVLGSLLVVSAVMNIGLIAGAPEDVWSRWDIAAQAWVLLLLAFFPYMAMNIMNARWSPAIKSEKDPEASKFGRLDEFVLSKFLLPLFERIVGRRPAGGDLAFAVTKSMRGVLRLFLFAFAINYLAMVYTKDVIAVIDVIFGVMSLFFVPAVVWASIVDFASQRDSIGSVAKALLRRSVWLVVLLTIFAIAWVPVLGLLYLAKWIWDPELVSYYIAVTGSVSMLSIGGYHLVRHCLWLLSDWRRLKSLRRNDELHSKWVIDMCFAFKTSWGRRRLLDHLLSWGGKLSDPVTDSRLSRLDFGSRERLAQLRGRVLGLD
jgi:hypothetical protein